MPSQIMSKDVPVFGLNTNDDSATFDSPYSPYMKNVVVETTRIKKRMGYTKLGFSDNSPPLNGLGMELINYKDALGESHLIALTTTDAYLYKPALRNVNNEIIEGSESKWLNITPISKTKFAEKYSIDFRFYLMHNSTVIRAQLTTDAFELLIDDSDEDRQTIAETFWIEFRDRDETDKYTAFTYYSSITEETVWVELDTGETPTDEYEISDGITFKILDRDLFDTLDVVENQRPVLVFTVPEKAQNVVLGLDIVTDDYYRTLTEATLDITINSDSDNITYSYNGATPVVLSTDWGEDLNTQIALGSTGAYVEINDDFDSFGEEFNITIPREGLFATQQFTGSVANRFSHCVVTDMNKFTKRSGSALLITNNIDGIFYYEGSSSERFKRFTYTETVEEVEITKELGFAKEIIEFWNHLFLCNFQIANYRDVRSLVHSGAGDMNSWYGEGSSGSYTLTDSRGSIKRVVKLGAALVIYSGNSITLGRHYGGLTPFAFPTMVYETGLLSDKAVWDSVNVHFFLGNDQRVYAYYGETHLVPIAERIEDSLFREIDATKTNMIVSGLDIGRHKLHFCIPTVGSDSDYPFTTYTLNYKRNELSWEYHRYADAIRDLGVFMSTYTWYCDEPPFTYGETDERNKSCDEVIIFCDESYGQEGYDTSCFISAFIDDNSKPKCYVYEINNIDDKDDGVDIEFELHTPDFTIAAEENFARWQWLSFVAKSDIADSKVTVQYAVENNIDDNDWYTIKSDMLLSDKWTTYRIPLDIDARVIRFRILNYSGDVQIRGTFKAKAIIHTERD
jgi:hypothetical protein